ncbi:unnamed protein product, partial [Urochloa humidicola]
GAGWAPAAQLAAPKARGPARQTAARGLGGARPRRRGAWPQSCAGRPIGAAAEARDPGGTRTGAADGGALLRRRAGSAGGVRPRRRTGTADGDVLLRRHAVAYGRGGAPAQWTAARCSGGARAVHGRGGARAAPAAYGCGGAPAQRTAVAARGSGGARAGLSAGGEGLAGRRRAGRPFSAADGVTSVPCKITLLPTLLHTMNPVNRRPEEGAMESHGVSSVPSGQAAPPAPAGRGTLPMPGVHASSLSPGGHGALPVSAGQTLPPAPAGQVAPAVPAGQATPIPASQIAPAVPQAPSTG